VTNSPWRVVDYWSMTHDPDPAEFRLERLPQIPMTDSHSDPDAGIESGRTRP
jgi:hypothetical protein